MSGKKVIVELAAGVWLTDGEGDPPRTLVAENARVFASSGEAQSALDDARLFRPFASARVVSVLRSGGVFLSEG